MTRHARREINNDNLTVYDVESAILTGQILERQRDRQTGERKYRIRGKSLAGDDTELVARIGLTGYLIIITVYVPGT
jgi:hypothetical protein